LAAADLASPPSAVVPEPVRQAQVPVQEEEDRFSALPFPNLDDDEYESAVKDGLGDDHRVDDLDHVDDNDGSYGDVDGDDGAARAWWPDDLPATLVRLRPAPFVSWNATVIVVVSPNFQRNTPYLKRETKAARFLLCSPVCLLVMEQYPVSCPDMTKTKQLTMDSVLSTSNSTPTALLRLRDPLPSLSLNIVPD
jgi:hypothetical protein